MSIGKVLPALKKFFQDYQIFLENQQDIIGAQPTFFNPKLQFTNLLYISNIKHTLKHLDKIHRVLSAEPNNEKASCKVIEYAARAKDTLERIDLRAKIRTTTTHILPHVIMIEPTQTQALLTQLKEAIGEERFKQLPQPQKHWLDTQAQIEESAEIERLAQQLSPPSPENIKTLAIQFGSLRRQQLALREVQSTGISATSRAKL